MTENKAVGQDMDKALFVNLIMMFTSSAMQQLGKLVDPETNKAEVNLQGAQIWIDMLSMVRSKTKGNLDEDENRMLDESISSLQMNYVETAKEHPDQADRADRKAPEAAATPTEAPAAEDRTAEQPAPESRKESASAPKYHKSYGG